MRSPKQYIVARGFSKAWFGAGFGFFLVAAILGCLLRFYWIGDFTGIPYKHLLHAHSHVALLGWGFTLLSGGLLFTMLPRERADRTPYRWVLGLTVVSAIGMSITFCLEGYGMLSISFCTLHLVAGYLFSFYFLRDLRQLPASPQRRLAKWAVRWMLISTIGLWAVGPISAVLGKLHPLFYASIQFFLHLQFNGWLTFGMLAILIGWLSRRGHQVSLSKRLFMALQLSVILTYALSVSWSTPLVIVFLLNSIGVLLQLVVFGLIAYRFLPAIRAIDIKKGYLKKLLWIGLGSLAAKIIIQSLVAIPAVAEVSYTIRNFVIGFIHLTALGSITLTLIAILVSEGLLPNFKLTVTGYLLLLWAFVSTEILLFGQGVLIWLGLGFIPSYYEFIFGCSLLFPLGLALTITGFLRKKIFQDSPSIHTKSIS